MMHRKSVKVLAVGALAALPLIASAQAAAAAEPAPAPNLTGNVSLTTNYKFRGQDQDMLGKDDFAKDSYFKPAIQGGLDYAFGSSGFYVGNWNSSVNWLKGNSIEMDFYGGYKFKGGPIDWDVGVLTYVYPGNTAGNTTELYGAGTWADDAIGAFTAKYSWTVSKDYFNYAGNKGGSGLDGTNTGYLNLAYTKEIVPKVTLKVAVGYTFFSSDIKSLGYKDYLDYNVGAAYDFGSGLSLGGYIQGGNEQSAFNQVASPGIPSPIGPIGQTTYSPNATRFIVMLTKTL